MMESLEERVNKAARTISLIITLKKPEEKLGTKTICILDDLTFYMTDGKVDSDLGKFWKENEKLLGE